MLAASLLALGACTADDPAGGASAPLPSASGGMTGHAPPATRSTRAPGVDGTEWQLAALAGKPVGPGRDSVPSLSLQRDGGQFGGHAGCNRYAGSYTRDGDQVRFNVGSITKRMCDIAAMKQERAFLGMLRGAARLVMRDGSLLVLDQQGVELARFAPAGTPAY